MLKLDLGCGAKKKEGFLGVDSVKCDGVDFVMDLTKDRLPLEDDSVDEIFSSHFFEHITDIKPVLKEMVRVSVNETKMEVWTPHLKSDPAFVLGHRYFYNEIIWRHICVEFPHIWFKDIDATFRLDRIVYVLHPHIEEELEKQNISLPFALKHLFNISPEFCVFMTLLKGKNVEKRSYGEPEV